MLIDWREVAPPEAKPKIFDASKIKDLVYEAKGCASMDDNSSTSSNEASGKVSGGIKRGFKGLFSQPTAKFAKSIKR